MTSIDEPLETSVRDFLAEVAARTPAPGAGAVAAVVVGLAAGLVSMAGRFSDRSWDGAPNAVERAETLRLRAEPLAARDAESYARVLAAYRIPTESDPRARDAAIASALRGATEVPLEISEVAAEVAQIAADLVEHGNRNLRGDAAAGALFAEAAATAAAALVAINLSSKPDDESVARAAALAQTAREAADRALRG